MNLLNEVVTIAEANEMIGRGRTYLNDMIAAGKLTDGCHYRSAGRVKLVLKVVVDKIKSGEQISFVGRKWSTLDEYEKEFLLRNANCVDGISGNDAYKGECIVDLTDSLSVPGTLSDESIISIDDNAVIYSPIA